MKCVVEFLFVGEEKARERRKSFVELFAIEYTCSCDVVVERFIEVRGQEVGRVDAIEKAKRVLRRMIARRFRNFVDGVVELEIPDVDRTSPTAVARILVGA